jgi:N-acetylglucosamine-6-phosphate deacetylase
MGHQNWLIRGGDIYTPQGVIPNGAMAVRGGRINWIGKGSEIPSDVKDLPELNADGAYVLPGFIDIHLHGGGGVDVMDATQEALKIICSTHAKFGTTGILPTTVTQSSQRLKLAAEAVKKGIKASGDPKWPGARILGLRIEGPFFNLNKIGAQNPTFVRMPNQEEMETYLKIMDNDLRLVDMSPELPNALELAKWLIEKGVFVTMAHTNATYEEACKAIAVGMKHCTHLFNGMSGLNHRQPGVVGAALNHPEVMVEMIVDGIHLHPAVIKISHRIKGDDRICLITDAMAAMGMPDGIYDLGGLDVIVKDGACRLKSGALAGSILSLDKAIKNMVTLIGVPLESAVKMATINPAKAVGLDNERGSLETGKWADVVFMSEDFRVELTMVEGRTVYRNN